MNNSPSASNPGSTTPQRSQADSLTASLATMAALLQSTEETRAQMVSPGNEQAAGREQARAAFESIATALQQTTAAVQSLARDQKGASESVLAIQGGAESSSAGLRE